MPEPDAVAVHGHHLETEHPLPHCSSERAGAQGNVDRKRQKEAHGEERSGSQQQGHECSPCSRRDWTRDITDDQRNSKEGNGIDTESRNPSEKKPLPENYRAPEWANDKAG